MSRMRFICLALSCLLVGQGCATHEELRAVARTEIDDPLALMPTYYRKSLRIGPTLTETFGVQSPMHRRTLALGAIAYPVLCVIIIAFCRIRGYPERP